MVKEMQEEKGDFQIKQKMLWELDSVYDCAIRLFQDTKKLT